MNCCLIAQSELILPPKVLDFFTKRVSSLSLNLTSLDSQNTGRRQRDSLPENDRTSAPARVLSSLKPRELRLHCPHSFWLFESPSKFPWALLIVFSSCHSPQNITLPHPLQGQSKGLRCTRSGLLQQGLLILVPIFYTSYFSCCCNQISDNKRIKRRYAFTI